MKSGLWAIAPANQIPLPIAQLSKAYLTGFAARSAWVDIETAPGVFNWTYFDRVVVDTPAHLEVELIVLMAGIGNSPAWLSGLGVDYVTYDNSGTTVTVPVPWDATFMARRDLFIAAVGARYASNPRVTMVDFSSFAAVGGDFAFPADSAVIADFKTFGYTTAVAIDCIQSSIDAAMAAFPEKAYACAVGRMPTGYDAPGTDPDYVCVEVVTYAQAAYPARYYPFRANWATTIPAPPDTNLLSYQTIYDALPYAGLQALWYTNDVTVFPYRNNGGVPDTLENIMQHMFDKGLAYPVLLYQIYLSDINLVTGWSDAIFTNTAAQIAALVAALPVDPDDPIDPVVPDPIGVVYPTSVNYPDAVVFDVPARSRSFVFGAQ